MNVYTVTIRCESDDCVYCEVFTTRKLACRSLNNISFDDSNREVINEFLNCHIDGIIVHGEYAENEKATFTIECQEVIAE